MALERKVNDTLKTLRKVLATEKEQPVIAGEQPHQYDDKYALAESLLCLTVASWLGCLEALGLDRAAIGGLASKAKGLTRLTLRTRARESCEFLREATRTEQTGTKVEHKSNSIFGASSSETRLVTEVKEYFWRVGQIYEIFIFTGASEDAADGVRFRLAQREASCEVITRTANPPLNQTRGRADRPMAESDVTWLFARLAPAADATSPLSVSVSIDRDDPKCVTPRRNPIVDEAIAAATEFQRWLTSVTAIFDFAKRVTSQVPPGQPATAYPDARGGGVVPILPLLTPPAAADADGEKEDEEDGGGESLGGLGSLNVGQVVSAELGGTGVAAAPAAPAAPLLVFHGGLAGTQLARGRPALSLSPGVMHSLLATQRTATDEKLQDLTRSYPPSPDPTNLLSAKEACLNWVACHCRDALLQFVECIHYVEEMMRTQLTDAVGRQLTPADFRSYMIHHHSKLFARPYLPQPFCFSVRQPNRSPEGTVSINGDQGSDADNASPIHTIVRDLGAAAEPMTFPLDAATRVAFSGQRFLHAYIDHRFSAGGRSHGSSSGSLDLSVVARQFSCFMLLVGKMGAGGTFKPSHALVVRNKDELRITLLLEQMPSAGEFRDAIASLSPEQQRFAKAYRSMQLEGSVCGVLIVQLKPALERVLGLPADSLTKEIALTQRLLELFIDYQIPSDLLTYDGEADAPTADKLAAVRAHVAAIDGTIEAAKKAEVEAARQEHEYRHPRRARNVNPIEKLEKSVLIVAEAIHGCNARQLVRGDAIERLQAYAAPELLPPEP